MIGFKLAPISFGVEGEEGEDRGRALSLGKKERPLIYYLPNNIKNEPLMTGESSLHGCLGSCAE